jgi:hypothetical protein
MACIVLHAEQTSTDIRTDNGSPGGYRWALLDILCGCAARTLDDVSETMVGRKTSL